MKNYRTMFFLVIIFFIVGFNTAIAEDVGIESELFSYISYNYDEEKELISYNGDNIYAIASITKLMTYYITMDAVEKGEVALDDQVLIGANPVKKKGSTMELSEGDILSLNKLIEGIMVCSANDACVAIDEHVAGSEAAFVAKMNEEAKKMGLKSARFINSTGLTENGNYNIMSARDISILAKNILDRFPEALEHTSKRYFEYNGEIYPNTNPLLWEMEGVDGLKTGATIQAKNCLVATMKMPLNIYNAQAKRIVVVTIGAETEEIRKNTTKKLLEYTYENFGYKKIASRIRYEEKLTLKNGEVVYAYPKKDISAFMSKENRYEKHIQLDIDTMDTDRVLAGTVVGQVEVYQNGKFYAKTELVIKAEPKYYEWLTKLFQKNFQQESIA